MISGASEEKSAFETCNEVGDFAIITGNPLVGTSGLPEYQKEKV